MDRTFFPGSEWLYFKIYLKPESSDTILVKHIYPLVKKLLKQQLIDGWFFIRYSDPDYHIRLRFKISDSKHLGEIMTALYTTFQLPIRKHLISRIVIDTYIREIERYGSFGMERCESIFQYDSTLVCESLNDEKMTKWIAGVLAMFYISKSVFPDTEDQLNFISRRAKSYENEFNFNQDSMKQFNDLYRRHKQALMKVVDDEVIDDLKPIYSKLKKYRRIIDDSTEKMSADVLSSIIHMHFNRLFASSQRLAECMCYILLERALKSYIARHKQAVN